MKKVLTIYVDDDADLRNMCAAFVCWKGNLTSLTMLNETIPKDVTGVYLPWKSTTEKTEWIVDSTLPDIIQNDFDEWDKEKGVVIGKRIKAALDAKGMTQRELAKKIRVREVSVSRYVTGNRIPRAPILMEMARVLGVSCDFLMGVIE